jgi:TPR repeat protein
MGYKKGINTRRWAMSGIQGSPFRVILLAATILTLLAISSLSADIKTLRKQAEAGDAKTQFNIAAMYENGSGVKQDSDAKDRIAKELTPEKLTEAQHMAREWEKSHPRK